MRAKDCWRRWRALRREGRARHARRWWSYLDRFDREELAPPRKLGMVHGWHSAIMLLGLTDWIERVQRASDAGRMVPLFRRARWTATTGREEHVRAAAEQPDDPQRFVSASLMPFDDPTKHLGWWPWDPAGGPEVIRSATTSLAGWIGAPLAARRNGHDSAWNGPTASSLRWPSVLNVCCLSGYLPTIVGTSEAGPVFDSPQHDAYVAELLARWFATIERSLGRR